MPTFTTDTGTIYYEVYGPQIPTAPTLTLLHNFMSSGRRAWGPMLPALSERYRVILPDAPGHGRSQGYPAHFNHTELARQLAALLKFENAQQGHLAGVSSGGMIAQLMVHHGLAQPATLTLVSTTYSNNPDTTGIDRPRDPKHFKAGKRWLEATAKLHDPYHYDGYFDEVLLAGFRQLSYADTLDLSLADLAKWELPVCIVHGDHDEFFPEQIVRDMTAALPNAELHIVSGQTHALIFRRPWAVQEPLLNFLERHTEPV